jgi:hypothetical protein
MRYFCQSTRKRLINKAIQNQKKLTKPNIYDCLILHLKYVVIIKKQSIKLLQHKRLLKMLFKVRGTKKAAIATCNGGWKNRDDF